MTDWRAVSWSIGLEGRSWSGEEMLARLDLMPEKTEVIGGKLYWTDEDRLIMLAVLLENVGAGAAVRIGDPEVWRRAVAMLESR